ncbi:vWA domain-containing protein [Mycobacterium sp. 852002-40037_SCH5390672]|uniref:vWA domain-containing protein n=1 Tax=Mycobacterium sp. 852002-40037_SCH5390672 TaxID=1834089 RepID=UPI001E3821B1|nr:vWA domain-containing protein [Mycobacterium sp. 852002-40037_SCH5390672]
MTDSSRISRGRNGIAMLVRVAAAAALVVVLNVVGWAPVASATGSPGASRFGACLASQKTGDLLLLFDESSSLQQTDPQAARVQAARYLVQTLGKYADRVNAKLDVAVAGFSDTYVPEHDWTQLTGSSADSVGASLDPIAKKNTGIDTDYWLALDGARQALTTHAGAANKGQRCQAIAWFSDGMIDFTARPVAKPYADGVKLDSPNGIPDTTQKAVQSICHPSGLADQLRSSNIIMLGIGLGAKQTPGDFNVMSAISTGKGLQGMACGAITDPVPGDFFPVANIDDMLFAFDALNPDPGVTDQGGVCQIKVCPEARHNFVLDRSIKEVNILGSGGVPGVEPYLVSPTGQILPLPKKDGAQNVNVDGVSVNYQWQSESAQTISLQNGNAPHWSGQWAIVYVDTTGQHADAVSKVSIHITTDIFPALTGGDKVAWHSGQTLKGLIFGLVDGQGKPMAPSDLAGTATMSASLAPDGAAPIPLLTAAGKDDIAKPVDADLTKATPGHATLRMSLVITTASTTDLNGGPIAGTQLSPQEVDVPVQILPKVGLPTPGERIDFGTVEGAKGATATLNITGPGCAWISDTDTATVAGAPDGIGTPHVGSPTNSGQHCLKVPAGETAQLSVTLRTDHNGHGGLNGTVPVHVSTLDNPDDAQTVPVAFTASMINPLNTTNFILVLIAALLLGPGIPLALLYASKWWVSKIPDNPLLAERIPVQVEHDAVLRGGEPFAMADTDLVQPVTGLPPGGTRQLCVAGINLSVVMGRSPFGSGQVVVNAEGLISVGSKLPGSDKTGLRAVLPLAVHNTWVLLHNPYGPENAAEVLLLVAGTTDTTARERLYEDIAQRLPDLLTGLRLRAVQAGMTAPFAAPGETASPFGDTPASVVAGPVGNDPFGGGDSPFGGASAASAPPAAAPKPAPPPVPPPPAATGPVPPGFNEAETQERPIPEPIPRQDDTMAAGYRYDDERDQHDEREEGEPPGLPPTEATQPSYRFDPNPFDPFGEGT